MQDTVPRSSEDSKDKTPFPLKFSTLYILTFLSSSYEISPRKFSSKKLLRVRSNFLDNSKNSSPLGRTIQRVDQHAIIKKTKQNSWTYSSKAIQKCLLYKIIYTI